MVWILNSNEKQPFCTAHTHTQTRSNNPEKKNPVNLKQFSFYQLLHNAQRQIQFCVWSELWFHLCDCSTGIASKWLYQMHDYLREKKYAIFCPVQISQRAIKKSRFLTCLSTFGFFKASFGSSELMVDWINHNHYFATFYNMCLCVCAPFFRMVCVLIEF